MKSQYGERETIGSQIVSTHEKHLKSDPIECGEITEAYGKNYMRNLFDYIEEGSRKFDHFYVIIMSRKTAQFNYRGIEVFPFISPSLPPMQANQDVWYVDCVRQHYELLWCLPDEKEFDVILSNPNKDNESLIRWINIFKEGTAIF